jgi:arsenite-transporting ATPase
MTQYIFFSGKGGVGKTTMACATAVDYAQAGRKTLLVSTDPASNLADVFEQKIGHTITPIKDAENLWAVEIDPDEATKEYKERIIAPFRGLMPDDVIESIDEQLSGPCTTEMAAFDRFIDFMQTSDYDFVIFDTAPTGHTIRLLELPVDWSTHIEEAAKGSGQTCMGPVQTIQESRNRYDKATQLLRDPTQTKFIFVMRPEELSLYETQRALGELGQLGITSAETIINGVLPPEVCDIDFFKKKYEAQQEVIRKTEAAIPTPKRFTLLRDNEVKGVAAFRDIAAELVHDRKPVFKSNSGSTAPASSSLRGPDTAALWQPVNGHTRAIFFTGKGGVGKTTVSCLAALHLAGQGFNTLLVTTDPAAHIGEVLDVEVGHEPVPVTENLHAVMVDQEEAFRQYKKKTLDEARGKYSDDMLVAMEEELNSPCTQEMAAFDRFIQFIESARYEVIVFDTAPTGHTLRLLDLPFDYARQVEMMFAADETRAAKEAPRERFGNIIDILRNPERAVFNLVLYPESTPILESYRAMKELKSAGIKTQMIVANMILPEEVCVNDFFKNRRNMQLRYLLEIQEKFKLPVLQLPLMGNNLKGAMLRQSISILTPSAL